MIVPVVSRKRNLWVMILLCLCHLVIVVKVVHMLLKTGLILVIYGAGKWEKGSTVLAITKIDTCIFQNLFRSSLLIGKTVSKASLRLNVILKESFPTLTRKNSLPNFAGRFPQRSHPLQKLDLLCPTSYYIKTYQPSAENAESVSVPLPVKSLEIKNEETEETPVWRKRKRNSESYRRSTRKSLSPVFPPIEEDAGVNYEFCSINKEASIESDQLLSCDDGSENLVASNEGSDDILTAPEISPNGITVENVDECFNSLEDIFTLPDTETSLNNPVMRNIALENEKTECQKKLSTLLAMDFPSLLSSDNLVELSILVSQLREDHSLTVDQLTNLKLVEEIPFIQEAFLKAKGNIEQADKFFNDLEAKKDKVTYLEKEHGELKGEVAEIQTEIDSSTLEIQELDDQILQLQSKRDAMLSSLETKQKIKVDLTSTQTRLAGSILSIVHEIELGLSEKPKWELEKIKSARLKAEILDKFVSLRGLTF